MASIRHFPATHPLPDWRNFGVMLRMLLGVNLLAGLGALVQAASPRQWADLFLEQAAVVEPLLLLSLAALSALRNLLWRLPLRIGQLTVVVLVTVLTACFLIYTRTLAFGGDANPWRAMLLAAAIAGLMLGYFDLRARTFSPAQAEARLAALNARIRPHFLFNSLNAVLSLIRARPQQAEEALESLSDLFRAAMRDPGAKVSLADEIGLARQYLALEHLRLGDRLRVDWQVEPAALDLQMPPLMLQPLLENAVYHGIEPAPDGGTIRIALSRKGDVLEIAIANPTSGHAQHAAGNQIAVANIRERLALYYDLEARLEIDAGAQTYEVRIILPCPAKMP